VEGHAALPDLDDVERVFGHVGPAVKQDVAQPPARDDTQHHVEDQVIDLLRTYGRPGQPAAAARQPPARQETEHVHHAVPANLETEDRKDDRIDLWVCQHAGRLGVDLVAASLTILGDAL
jgi:hypothetical protein